MKRTILNQGRDYSGNTIVLAQIDKSYGTEYVTWASNGDLTSFYWGHYFTTLEAAEADFQIRLHN